MSWSQWVVGPNGLINADSQIENAGIYGHDGTVWAEEGMNCRPEEIQFITKMFIDPHYARENGFQVSGKRYLYIREDMESGAWNQSVIHGRTGLCPISIYKSAKAIVIGVGKADAITGKIAVTVCKIGDSLASFGL